MRWLERAVERAVERAIKAALDDRLATMQAAIESGAPFTTEMVDRRDLFGDTLDKSGATR